MQYFGEEAYVRKEKGVKYRKYLEGGGIKEL